MRCLRPIITRSGFWRSAGTSSREGTANDVPAHGHRPRGAVDAVGEPGLGREGGMKADYPGAIVVPAKACWRCERVLPLDSFSPRNTRCKQCSAEMVREWRLANPAKRAAQKKRWYSRHRVDILGQAALRRDDAGRREAACQTSRKWRTRHPGYASRAAMDWKRLHPDRVAVYGGRRRARLRGDLSGKQWEAILSAHCGACVYCGTVEDVGQDHIVALARGGEHTATNVVPACGLCNSRKGTKPWP